MKPILVTPLSHLPHNSQILTGFQMLRQQGFPIRFACSSENLPPDTALVRTEYLGKTILYDLWDGYHNPTAMRLGLNQADFYFKRSFSREKKMART